MLAARLVVVVVGRGGKGDQTLLSTGVGGECGPQTPTQRTLHQTEALIDTSTRSHANLNFTLGFIYIQREGRPTWAYNTLLRVHGGASG